MSLLSKLLLCENWQNLIIEIILQNIVIYGHVQLHLEIYNLLPHGGPGKPKLWDGQDS